MGDCSRRSGGAAQPGGLPAATAASLPRHRCGGCLARKNIWKQALWYRLVGGAALALLGLLRRPPKRSVWCVPREHIHCRGGWGVGRGGAAMAALCLPASGLVASRHADALPPGLLPG